LLTRHDSTESPIFSDFKSDLARVAHFNVPENIYTHPEEGSWKCHVGEGERSSLKPKIRNT